MAAIAAAAFVAIFVVNVPFPLIIIGAAVIGYMGARTRPELFPSPIDHTSGGDQDDVLIGDHHEAVDGGGWKRALRVLVVGLAVWWGPLLIVLAARGLGDTLSKEALFFSQTAMVTFGGAYAVLSYINQAAVQTFGWLDPGQMVTGLGLAESTPGPLIMVTEFVGFLGAYRFPGGLDPVVAGTLGALVTVWATFAPCFLWIFLGAPFIERLRGNATIDTTLSAVTAAVVGVILNLAVAFALATLFEDVSAVRIGSFTVSVPVMGSVDLFALALAAVAFVALWRYRVNVLWAVGGSAVAGLLYRVAF
jgi:chromate transporter